MPDQEQVLTVGGGVRGGGTEIPHQKRIFHIRFIPKTVYNKIVDSPKNMKSLSVLSPGIGGWNQCFYHLSSMILPYYDQ